MIEDILKMEEEHAEVGAREGAIEYDPRKGVASVCAQRASHREGAAADAVLDDHPSNFGIGKGLLRSRPTGLYMVDSHRAGGSSNDDVPDPMRRVFFEPETYSYLGNLCTSVSVLV
jgi:hypothetical protein